MPSDKSHRCSAAHSLDSHDYSSLFHLLTDFMLDKNGKEQTVAHTPEAAPAQPAMNKQHLFRAYRPLQNLAEKASSLEVTLKVIAQSDTLLDASWLRNAVEEPLDEADVTFDGRLEEGA